MIGQVIKTTGNIYLTKIGEDIVEAGIKGRFRIHDIQTTNPIVVGDIVKLTNDSGTFIINELVDRKNYIVRKSVNLSKQEHIIASNIDQAILLITLTNPITTTSFIDRFLVSAYFKKIDVLMIFNKIDLYDNKTIEKHDYLINIYESIGYKTISISTLNDSLNHIKSFMKNKINLISGHSGVGKSTFINRLQPNLDLKTKSISTSHKQGQHTTTFSQLYELDFGASIIDTPGIRGFGLINITKKQISECFPEFLMLMPYCKFNNCMHVNEPNCAVKLGLETNKISLSRYESYLSMLDDGASNYRNNI